MSFTSLLVLAAGRKQQKRAGNPDPVRGGEAPLAHAKRCITLCLLHWSIPTKARVVKRQGLCFHHLSTATVKADPVSTNKLTKEVLVNYNELFNTPNREKLVRRVRGFCLCMHTACFKMLAKAGFSGYIYTQSVLLSAVPKRSQRQAKVPP